MMHFVLQTPSLQQLAGVKIVSHLWSQPDIFFQKPTSYFHGIPIYRILDAEEKEWIAEMEEKVKGKVLALPCPDPCIKQLLSFINPIGTEIVDWSCYHNGDMNIGITLLSHNQLRWTMHGNVDYAKTAEIMVKDERLDVQKRYEVACINCLEDEARELYERMGDDAERRAEYFEYVKKVWRGENEEHPLIIFFTCSLSGRVRLLKEHFLIYQHESINQRLFKDTLRQGTRATCEYVFKTLKRREKNKVLVEYGERQGDQWKWAMEHSPSCNFLYYLWLMNEEQQRLIFRYCAPDVLKFFLRWPMQSLFVEAAKCGWQLMERLELGHRGFLNDNDRDNSTVLIAITDKINNGFLDYDYSHLFWECWRMSSAQYKLHFLSNNFNLRRLLSTKREEFIKLIVNEAPPHLIENLLINGNGEMSDVFMDESAMSDAALMECKEAAALNRANQPNDMKKRLRSEHVSRIIDLVMENRIKSKEKF